MSRDVSELWKRVNCRLFGNHFSRHYRVRVATYCVQERSVRDGLHTHALVGVPNGSLGLKVNPPTEPVGELIAQTWVKLDPMARSTRAQDFQAVYDLFGAAGYINKGVRSLDDFDQVDLMNTIGPI